MPYSRNADLPAGVKNALPAAAQTVYRRAYNGASGDESSRAAQAWTAVKNGWKKVGDQWVAKEANVPIAKADMSAEDKRRILQSALDVKFPRDSQAYGYTPSPWIYDVYDESVVYDLGGASFQVDYQMSRAGKVTLGEDTRKVIATTTYTTIDSAREQYQELIRVAAERGIPGDALKEVTRDCEKLFDLDEPTEGAIDEVGRRAVSAVQWVKRQEASRSIDGNRYPVDAFAYVPDRERPSTWELRLWENGQETKSQLDKASASLSPGGLSGQKVAIPESDLPGVKATIRAAYRRCGIDDFPRWVKEDMMRARVTESVEVDISEVTKAGIAKGILPIRIIVPGFNSSKSRFYSEQAIKDAAEIFNGTKMFADHATEAEEEAKPERSIKDWVATLHETKVSDVGNAVGVAHINTPWLKEKVSALYEQGDLEHLGTSINAVGKGTTQTIEGTKTVLVEGLVKSVMQSVDFVTEPGAGGQAGLRESAEGVLDVDLMDESQLREARPDLVTGIETRIRESMREEAKRVMETEEKVKGLEDQVTTLTDENTELKKEKAEAAQEKAKAEAQATIKGAVNKAELPDAAKTKLLERFKDATSDEGLADAITAESDYIKELVGTGVKGLGDTRVPTEEQAKADRAALKESFITSGMSEDAAEAACDR